jgi:uncharacterized protein (UPF0261 family)
MTEQSVYVAGTCDTKGVELRYVRQLIEQAGVAVRVVDLSTLQTGNGADVSPTEVAKWHPDGPQAVFTGDRGRSVGAMATAFARYMAVRDDVAGLLGLGGSGGTALVTPAMRALPIGVPKLMVSTVASGNVAAYVGPTDITMMYSVADMAGLNRLSRVILANAAHAMAGMARGVRPALAAEEKPAIGLSMFGVTTPCVNQVVAALDGEYDCLVFHATGTGGQSMEKLAESGLMRGVLDVTTTEVCDLLMGGTFPCTEDRFGAIARSGIPYVGSCGALDMVNFGAIDTVPSHYRERTLYVHNPQVTLMRTTAEENARVGRWIGERLNLCEGAVRFLLPNGGVSALDAPDMPFFDPAADAVLFRTIEATVRQTDRRRLMRLPYNVNAPEFAQAVVTQFREIVES